MGIDKRIAYDNRRLANVAYSSGELSALCYYIDDGCFPSNFMICGGPGTVNRYRPVEIYLDKYIGRIPIIILHNRNTLLETIAYRISARKEMAAAPIIINRNNPVFEPFYGMSPAQAPGALHRIAEGICAQIPHGFERVVKAHIEILQLLGRPISLSGFRYLCGFDEIPLRNGVMQLPCSKEQSYQIWADLGADSRNENSAYDLFRTVISRVAEEALESGWNDNNAISDVSLLQAISQKRTILLSVDPICSEVMQSYFFEELRAANRHPFILIIDRIYLQDKRLLSFISRPSNTTALGLISDSVYDMFGGDEQVWKPALAGIRKYIFFKHNNAYSAEAASEIMGKMDYSRAEHAYGRNTPFMRLFPSGHHDDVRITTENRYRVMPEKITMLEDGQAIFFNADNDTIIEYN